MADASARAELNETSTPLAAVARKPTPSSPRPPPQPRKPRPALNGSRPALAKRNGGVGARAAGPPTALADAARAAHTLASSLDRLLQAAHTVEPPPPPGTPPTGREARRARVP